MSLVISYSVGDGDMFSIRHGSDNFTIIDCKIGEDDDWIIEELERQKSGKGISRFISTHPDQDHLSGLKRLDDELGIVNFYCIKNKAVKDDETEDFKHYCKLRDSDKAFYIYKGCSRKWLNESDDDRKSAGINILWPDTTNPDFQAALTEAENGNSPNDTSAIVKYSIKDGPSFLWMGDLETDFMEKIEASVAWPDIDILFAPHHGRKSATIPLGILEKLNPALIVLGEAPSEYLQYYPNHNTITQNSAGTIVFETDGSAVHIYVSQDNYSVDFLTNHGATTYKNYIGTLGT